MTYKFYNPDNSVKAVIKANSQEEAEAILESEEDNIPVKDYRFEVSIGNYTVRDTIEIEQGQDSVSTVEDYISSMERELFDTILEETEIPFFVFNEEKFYDNLCWSIEPTDESGISIEDWLR